MKINIQFDQSTFNRNEAPFKWSTFYCPYFNEIKLIMKNNTSLYLNFITDQEKIKGKKTIIIYLNTTKAQSLQKAKRILSKYKGSNIFFMKNYACFSENENTQKLRALMGKKIIAEFDASKLFKMSDTSNLEIIDLEPSAENCLCPVYNTLLSHGARLINSKIRKTEIVTHEFRLSLNHSVRILENIKS